MFEVCTECKLLWENVWRLSDVNIWIVQHYVVFFLRRKMIELGTTCVRKFVGAQSFQEIPMVLGISDVSFLQSVNVGDVSIIDARVYLCNPKTVIKYIFQIVQFHKGIV